MSASVSQFPAVVSGEAVSVSETPAVVSKSMLRAMQCETHFAAYYLDPDSAVRRIESPLAQTGTDFHGYRAAYIKRLMASGQPQDKTWALAWLDGAVVTDDARRLIDDDIRSYTLDADNCFGPEIFLSIDRAGNPLEQQFGGKPGTTSTDAQALASGTLDLLIFNGATARIDDYKSGWATATVSDFEPAVYAALVFAHFSFIETVEFRWEFTRLRTQKMFYYTRSEFPELLRIIRSGGDRKADIARRRTAGEKLRINPWAGLCQFCDLRCPLRNSVTDGSLMIPPVQSAADAQETAAVLYAAQRVAAMARDALKPWLAERGPMELSGDFIVEASERFVSKRPLLESLTVLGLDVSSLPPNSPAFDVPLGRLTLGNLSSFAKAKKRAGLAEQLGAVAIKSSSTQVKIRRLSEGEQLLEEGGEE